VGNAGGECRGVFQGGFIAVFSIARCPFLFRKLFRRPVSQAAMRSFFVVLRPPRCDLPPRIEQILKPTYVQTLFSQPSVKALDVRVLVVKRLFSRGDRLAPTASTCAPCGVTEQSQV
jgi:hypothetical protein